MTVMLMLMVVVVIELMVLIIVMVILIVVMVVIVMMAVCNQSAPFQWKAESGPMAHCTVGSLTGLAPVPGVRVRR